MSQNPSLLLTLLAFVLVLGPLVVIHELGHYLVGRFFGVKAEAFSVGFGKELFGRTDRRGTRWKLSALPLGGYVQFAGDMNAASMPDANAADGLTPAEREHLFQSKPLWQRALIVAAGPVTNLVFAVVIFAAFNLAYGKVVSQADVVGFYSQSDARAAGLQLGDRIVAINGKRVASVTDIPQYITPFPGQTVAITVERDGRQRVMPVKLTPHAVSDEFGNRATIADLGINYVEPVVEEFAKGSPAQQAGIREGDRIASLDGRQVDSHEDIVRTVMGKPGQTIAVGVRRDGRSLVYPVKLQTLVVKDKAGKAVSIGRLGVQMKRGERVGVGPLEAVGLAVDQTWGVIRMTITGIGQIFAGERSVKELGGPIKIAKYSGEQLSLGWTQFVSFVALISINLAFINLLPIPGLDGGHLAFYAAEAVRRKPLGLRSQEWAFRTGLALVLALMLFVTINDLAGLPFFGG